MDFTYEAAKNLLDLFGGDKETEITVTEVKENEANHSGPGLYAYYTEYPEEGSFLLKSPINKVEFTTNELTKENFLKRFAEIGSHKENWRNLIKNTKMLEDQK